jgi:hypothetical protein
VLASKLGASVPEPIVKSDKLAFVLALPPKENGENVPA